MKFIKKFINYFLKIFNLKLIKVVDQFSNSYRLVLALKEKNIDCVFDVGANEGQFTKELRHYGFEGKILSFEPILSVHKKLLKNSNKDDEWEVYKPVALGNQNIDNFINISKNSVSSSILDISVEHVENAPDSIFVEKQPIQERKLDDIFPELNVEEKNLFLKIDTQGYEFKVIQGAEKILKEFKGILVEVSLSQLYEGQKDWLDIIDFIKSKGFSLWSIDRGFSNKKNGKTLQIDLCFFK